MNQTKRNTYFFFLLSILLPTLACQDDTPKANLIITNANIWTANANQPKAQAFAIAGDTILAIGNHQAIQPFKGDNTKVVDLQGKFITPGLIDCHVHLMMGGNALLSVELRDANTPAIFTQRIADYAKTIDKGAWILEGNWDHTLWGSELPHKKWIDEFTQDNPVAIYRLDGHMILANSAALKIAGINKNTPDVKSGKIIKDKNGNLTGVLKGNAMNAVLDAIPPLSATRKENGLKAAMKYLLANGVTSVHDVDSIGTYPVAKKLKDAGELNLRIYSVNPVYRWQELAKINLQNDNLLKRGGLKGFVDGSLGSHTAAFHHGYTDQPADKGFFLNSATDLRKWVDNADKADFQVMVHAIGDSAIHALLDIYEDIIQKNGKKDRRLRIEHAQHLAPVDIKRFGQLGVIPSMQPYHAIDDGRWAEALIGPERIKTTYAFKSLLDANATIAFGSDWPVAPAIPLLGIHAAVTRQTLDGKNPNGWVPEQKISVEQALLAYTKNAAFAAFEEDIKGTLEVGKLADFVVFNADLTKVAPTKIKEVKVLQTYLGGRKVFETK
ncbi:MAG: amidohydrolase [Saprospiraceae bacterium]